MDMEVKSVVLRSRTGEAGFSMIEALIATAVLLIIAIGMIPLFARSMINNALGNDYTQASAHGLTGLEKDWKMPPESVDLGVAQRAQYVQKGLAGGSPVTDLDWSYTAPASADSIVWMRTTQVRLFPISALEDGEFAAAEAVPIGSSTATWQVMETTTLMDSGKVTSGKKGPFAAIRQTSFQFLKTY